MFWWPKGTHFFWSKIRKNFKDPRYCTKHFLRKGKNRSIRWNSFTYVCNIRSGICGSVLWNGSSLGCSSYWKITYNALSDFVYEHSYAFSQNLRTRRNCNFYCYNNSFLLFFCKKYSKDHYNNLLAGDYEVAVRYVRATLVMWIRLTTCQFLCPCSLHVFKIIFLSRTHLSHVDKTKIASKVCQPLIRQQVQVALIFSPGHGLINRKNRNGKLPSFAFFVFQNHLLISSCINLAP